MEIGLAWATKMVFLELVKTGYPDQIREIRKRLRNRPNRFRSVFEFDIPYFILIPNLSKKYENGPVKCRNRDGTERDLSRPFSTLSVIHAPQMLINYRG